MLNLNMVMKNLHLDIFGKSLNLRILSQTHQGYLKNHCTNTRLVCTHLNALFMLNPNMVMKNLNFEFFRSLYLTIFSQTHQGYLKNHWTNTRLVCTHFNVFLCWIQKWQRKFEFLNFFGKVWKNGLLSALDASTERVTQSPPLINDPDIRGGGIHIISIPFCLF